VGVAAAVVAEGELAAELAELTDGRAAGLGGLAWVVEGGGVAVDVVVPASGSTYC
jgi:hypothetical protein